MTAVHQLLPVLSYGDAIGAATIRMRAMLRSMGFESGIFAGALDNRMRSLASAARDLPTDLGRDDAVVYHLSIGSPLSTLFAMTAARKVVVYHNITPAKYFRDTNPVVSYWVEQGRKDLELLAPISDLVLGDSAFNLDDAVRAGANKCLELPLALDLDRLSPGPAVGSRPPVVLFVGRAAPNKRHDVLIRGLAAARATSGNAFRLMMVGTGDDTSAYVAALRRLAKELGVADAVEVRDERVADRMLGQYFRQADAFATASEHEGFCAPAIEAMSFSLPVVAYRAGALPETIGEAGILLPTHDPITWATALQRVLTDERLRRQLALAGRGRVAHFDPTLQNARLHDVLASIGIEP